MGILKRGFRERAFDFDRLLLIVFGVRVMRLTTRLTELPVKLPM